MSNAGSQLQASAASLTRACLQHQQLHGNPRARHRWFAGSVHYSAGRLPLPCKACLAFNPYILTSATTVCLSLSVYSLFLSLYTFKRLCPATWLARRGRTLVVSTIQAMAQSRLLTNAACSRGGEEEESESMQQQVLLAAI